MSSVAFGGGRVWAGFRDGTLRALDPGSGRTMETFRIPGTIDELAVADGSVWCMDAFDLVIRRVDPHTGKVQKAIKLGTVPSDIVGGREGVWVASLSVGTVLPIDTSSNKPGLPIRVGESPTSIAEGLGAVWVTDQDGFVRRIDPFTQAITRFRVGAPLAWIAVDGPHQDLWVAVGTLTR